MTDLEIPYEKDRHGHYRFFEILPGALSYILLLLPAALSYVSVTVDSVPINLAIFFILLYLLIYFVRSVGYSLRLVEGYRSMRQHMRLNWPELLADLEAGEVTDAAIDRPKWHLRHLRRQQIAADRLKPSQVMHVVIIATVNESREVLEPTIQALIGSDYDCKQNVILVFAYEGRAGKATHDRVTQLAKLYKRNFYDAVAYQHPPNIPGEIIGKGGNITYAGRQLQAYLAAKHIDPANVLVTTLDADNRPDPRYLAALTYTYCCAPNRQRASYQPLAMYTNNIWDVPVLMRAIATGNNLFYLVGSQRAHLARNFSAHAQPMQALIDMDFWSVRTVVEDGHQFWRSYFHFDGDYRVYPMSIPIYQDAVLADGYLRTMKAQFIQLRRWTYGASDVAYVADKAFFVRNRVPKLDALGKLLRLLEGHVSWATGALMVLAASRVPAILHPSAISAVQLPLIVQNVQRLGMFGLLVVGSVSVLTLPVRPARFNRRRSFLTNFEWLLTLVTGLTFGSLAAFTSQTRLMFKRYLSKFDVTEKAVKTDTGTVSSDADPK